MPTWNVTSTDPNSGTVQDMGNGQFNFPPNTSSNDIVYNINYTDDNGCTGFTTCTVKNCNCDCDGISLRVSSSYTFSATGGTINAAQVTSPCTVSDFTLEDVPSWITNGTSGDYITLTAENWSGDTRGPFEISFKYGDEVCKTMKVKQKSPCTLDLVELPFPDPKRGIVSGNTITFSGETCGTYDIHVQSNDSLYTPFTPQAIVTEGDEYIKNLTVDGPAWTNIVYRITFIPYPDKLAHTGKIRVTNSCDSEGIEIIINYQNSHDYEGTENGFEWVDLCLSSGTLWAKENYRPNNMSPFYYFSWGNGDGHSDGSGYDFSVANYQASSGFNLSSDIVQGSSYDMIRTNMGGRWVLPTVNQYKELFSSCTCVYDTTQDAIVFTSKRNGQQVIFKGDSCFYDGAFKICGSDCLFDFLWTCDFYDKSSYMISPYNANITRYCAGPDTPYDCNTLHTFNREGAYQGMQIRGCFKKESS